MTTAMAPDEADRKTLVVAALLERWVDHPAHGDDGADGGMRHRAEQFGSRHCRHGKRTAYPADHRHYHRDNPARDATLRHDFTGENEKRHGEQWKVVQAAEHVGLNDLGRDVGNSENCDDRGDEQNKENWKTEDKKRYRQTKEDDIGHCRGSLTRCLGAVSRAAARLREKADCDHQSHQTVTDRYHRLRNEEWKVRRLAPLVEGSELSDDRPGEHCHRSSSRDHYEFR